MKNKELFNRTIQVLVKAYLNNVLDATECTACAVGNMVAANMGYKITGDFYWSDGKDHYIWSKWQKAIWYNKRCVRAMQEIKSTGYNRNQLRKIESAFMFPPLKTSDRNFDGLMAVVDVLCDIHEMSDTTNQEAKALFVKPAAIGIGVESPEAESRGLVTDSPAIAQNKDLLR